MHHGLRPWNANQAVQGALAAFVKDTTGVFRPSNGLLYLKNSNNTGFADIAINYGIASDYPVVGDWDGNGTATIGIYRNGIFYLRNSNTIGFADIVVPWHTCDQPRGGRNNDGGIRSGSFARTFLLRNSNDAGAPELSFGLGNPGDVGIAGDWNGDGTDTTGVFRPINGIIFLKNTNDTGFADIALNYGIPGDKPVMGDWNNDGIDTIGVYRNGQFCCATPTGRFADRCLPPYSVTPIAATGMQLISIAAILSLENMAFPLRHSHVLTVKGNVGRL
jgi:hypothetical protein